jgi:hypothetical protein
MGQGWSLHPHGPEDAVSFSLPWVAASPVLALLQIPGMTMKKPLPKDRCLLTSLHDQARNAHGRVFAVCKILADIHDTVEQLANGIWARSWYDEDALKPIALDGTEIDWWAVLPYLPVNVQETIDAWMTSNDAQTSTRQAGSDPPAAIAIGTLTAFRFYLGVLDELADLQGEIARQIEAADTASREHKNARGQKKGTVNQRMLEILRNDGAEVHGYTCKQWALKLKCSESSVAESQAWKDLTLVRKEQRTQRAVVRRRNGRAIRFD